MTVVITFLLKFTKYLKSQIKTNASLAQVMSISQRFTHAVTPASQPLVKPSSNFFKEALTKRGALAG